MRWMMLSVVCLLTATQAVAQNFACTRNNGTRYSSPVPCPQAGSGSSATTGDVQQYMSAQCSTLYEGLRTAASRGLKYPDIASLQKDFQTQCSDNFAQARQRVQQEKAEEFRTKQEQQQAASSQTALGKEEQEKRRVQCAEMRSSIASRKARANSTDGEKNDLVIFEQRYRDRCY